MNVGNDRFSVRDVVTDIENGPVGVYCKFGLETMVRNADGEAIERTLKT